ncbi:MAG: HAD family hydrolase [Streptosporangiales bacterium]
MTDAVRWVVFDYGEVLSEPTVEVPNLAALAGAEGAAFSAAYWAERETYDRGLDGAEYWRRVAAYSAGSVDTQTAAKLTDLDTQGWARTVAESLTLVRELHAAGVPMALLSNAPATFARYLERQDWIALFDHLIVSGDLGYAKPDAAIWAELISRLGVPAAEVLFLDDKPTNVAGAREAGLQAEVWPGATSIRPRLVQRGLLAE